jgi:formylglycine-generating enzyme required for sulfatase activity
VVQEWTQTLWGSDAHAPTYQYPYAADDGRESVGADNREVRIFRVYRGWRAADKPEDARLPRRRASEARSALAWRGFRVIMELEPA